MACSIRTNHGKESPQSYFDKMKNKFKAWFFKKKAGSILIFGVIFGLIFVKNKIIFFIAYSV